MGAEKVGPAGPVAAAAIVALGVAMIASNRSAAEWLSRTFASDIAHDAHAILILDQAGWHTAKALAVPKKITLLPLPPRRPELNPQENVWAHLRRLKLAKRNFEAIDAFMDVCCDAWNDFADDPGCIRSIGSFPWITAAQSL